MFWRMEAWAWKHGYASESVDGPQEPGVLHDYKEIDAKASKMGWVSVQIQLQSHVLERKEKQ